MREYPEFEDLGLVENDRTEDLRPGNTTTPVLEHRGRQNQPITQMKEEVQ